MKLELDISYNPSVILVQAGMTERKSTKGRQHLKSRKELIERSTNALQFALDSRLRGNDEVRGFI